jgi:L-lactate dehydrogenase complex protein LldG
MSAKAAILARVHEALGASTRHNEGHGPVPRLAPPEEIRACLPPVPADYPERVALFARNSADLKTDFRQAGMMAEALPMLQELARTQAWTRVAFHDSPLLESAVSKLGAQVVRITPGYHVADLENCDVGFTLCDALIAQTGSVLLTSRSAGGRALSVLPPHHVVVATRDQMVGDLPEAFALLKTKYSGHYPSMISLVSGPSRTGDIERILVLGAHGPKKLTVVLLDRS